MKGAVSAPFAPGLDVGMSFDTGGSYEWLYCRPARGNARVYEAVRATFAEARLPQTSLTRIASKGHAITLRPNEFIASRVTGFLNLGVEASFGYKMQGKASYEMGAADLVTTLTMQARLSQGRLPARGRFSGGRHVGDGQARVGPGDRGEGPSFDL